jgi:Origin recognition complex subunit 2
MDQAALAALVSNSIVTDNTVPVESHSGTDHRSSRALRLIASIDNVDAIAALWTTEITHQFSSMYMEVRTYRPYIREIAVLASNETSGDVHASKLTQRRMKQCGRLPVKTIVCVINSYGHRKLRTGTFGSVVMAPCVWL